MTVDEKRPTASRLAAKLHALRPRARLLARRVLWRAAPSYARTRAARAQLAVSLGREESGLEHLGERHEERIERLENLARELILAAESLRREIVHVEAEAALAHRRIDQIAGELDAPSSLAGPEEAT